MTTPQKNGTTGTTGKTTTPVSPVTTNTTPTHIVLSDEDRFRVSGMIDALKESLRGSTSDALAEEVVRKLTGVPGSDSADAIRPLVQCLPPAVAVRLPDILEAEGTVAKTAVLSYIGRDVMFRMETAITYGSAFLALTDLECDSARPLRGC